MYIDGSKVATGDKKNGNHPTDSHTNLSLGNSNDAKVNFARFRMDLLAIFYYELTPEHIKALSNDEGLLL